MPFGWAVCPGPLSCRVPVALQPEGEHGEPQSGDSGDDGEGHPRDSLGVGDDVHDPQDDHIVIEILDQREGSSSHVFQKPHQGLDSGLL